MRKLCLLLALLLCLCGCDVVPLEELPTQQTEMTPPAVPEKEEEAPSRGGEPEPLPETAEPLAELLSLEQAGILLLDCDADAPGGPVLTLELRNASGEELLFSVPHASFGGVMCDPYWECAVPAGETVQSEVFWSEAQLERCRVTGGTLRLELRVCAGGTVLYDGLAELPAEDGTEAPLPLWEDSLSQVLAETEQVAVTARYLLENSLTLTVENRTGKELLCTVADVTVNGVPCDPAWAAFVMAESLCVSVIELPAAEPSKSVSMTLKIYDSEDRSAPTLLEKQVTVTVPE